MGAVVDTCHAWASGEDMATLIDRVRAATGRIDLLHCNDSRDPQGSSAIATPTSVQVKSPRTCLPRSAQRRAPIVVETPGGAAEHAVDIAW